MKINLNFIKINLKFEFKKINKIKQWSAIVLRSKSTVKVDSGDDVSKTVNLKILNLKNTIISTQSQPILHI